MMPATITAPVAITAIVAMQTTIIASPVIIVAVPRAIVVWSPPTAAPFVTDVTDLLRI
jgi:hypothetical protein